MADEIKVGAGAEKPKGHIRGIWAITIIVVIAILVGGGIWYFFYKTAVQDDATTNTTKTSASVSPSASGSALPSTSDIAETADWKTYSNSAYGFSFKYPTGWAIENPQNNKDETIVYVYSNDKFGPSVEQWQYFIWIDKSNSKPTTSYSQTEIAGYTAYKTDQEPSESGALSYYITKDEKTYIKVSFTPYDVNGVWDNQTQYINTFNQILSTFKFL